MSLWPNRGDADPRPSQDEPYAVVAPVAPVRPAVPAGFPRRPPGPVPVPVSGPVPMSGPVSVGHATMGG